MATPVVSYQLAWNAAENHGEIRIQYSSGKEKKLQNVGAAEFTALASILGKAPVFKTGKWLHTGIEPVED